MPLRIPYHDTNGYLRHYLPDFIVKTKEGRFYLLETKGEGWDEQVTVQAKTSAAQDWCEKVSELTADRWTFLKILDTDFERFQSLPFGQLIQALS